MAGLDPNQIMSFIEYTNNSQTLEKLLQSNNKPKIVVLETDDDIFKIDLKSRTIQEPPFLAVRSDHESEIVFFEVDRYYEGIDLSTAACLVQYKIIDSETREEKYSAHLIPFYDVQTKANEFKMIIPWDITDSVSKNATDVIFSFRFFKLDKNLQLSYNLNTLPATSKILDTVLFEDSDYEEVLPIDEASLIDEDGFIVDAEDIDRNYSPKMSNTAKNLFDEVMFLYRYLYDHDTVYWEILD